MPARGEIVQWLLPMTAFLFAALDNAQLVPAELAPVIGPSLAFSFALGLGVGAAPLAVGGQVVPGTVDVQVRVPAVFASQNGRFYSSSLSRSPVPLVVKVNG